MDTKRPKAKCPITKSPITKHPKLHITQKQNKIPNVTNRPKTKHPNNKNIQDNKKPKFTKCPKLQYVQSYKMFKVTKCPKLQNVQNYKMSQGYKILVTCILNIFVSRTKGITLERGKIRRVGEENTLFYQTQIDDNFLKMYISVTRFPTKYKLLLAYMHINNNC